MGPKEEQKVEIIKKKQRDDVHPYIPELKELY